MIVILTSGRQNDSNFDMRYFLSIRGPRLSRKNDPKSQNDGEFSHDPPPPKVHHKKLSRTKMLSLRKKISDLKNRPLNWDRVPYVVSKKNTFCQSGETECLVKTIPKSQNDGAF